MAGFVLDDLDLLALDDQGADVVERDVPALRRVVQTAVRVLLDQAFLAHEEAVYLRLPALHKRRERQPGGNGPPLSGGGESPQAALRATWTASSIRPANCAWLSVASLTNSFERL